MRFDASLREALLGARMNGENDRNFGSDGIHRAEKFAEFFRGIHIRRAMQREDAEALPISAFFQAEIIADRGFLRDGKKMAKRIDHDIADEMDGFARTAFFEEVLDSVFFGDEKIVGEGIGEDAIDFFGHRPIETAKAGFHVRDGDAELHGGKRDRDCGIDVADNQDEIGLAFD